MNYNFDQLYDIDDIDLNEILKEAVYAMPKNVHKGARLHEVYLNLFFKKIVYVGQQKIGYDRVGKDWRNYWKVKLFGGFVKENYKNMTHKVILSNLTKKEVNFIEEYLIKSLKTWAEDGFGGLNTQKGGDQKAQFGGVNENKYNQNKLNKKKTKAKNALKAGDLAAYIDYKKEFYNFAYNFLERSREWVEKAILTF